MPLLFVTPQEITSTTILGGNVDVDKYRFCIEDTQENFIEPLLGTELYERVIADITNNELSGDYMTLFVEYVKPITKNESLSKYIKLAPYTVANGGIYKHAPENSEVVSVSEVQYLSDQYSGLSSNYVQRFKKWIYKNNIPEYKRYQDEVNAIDVNGRTGWFL